MKKNNLKRFLASLLAVLMLASVTGVSPAVFAAGNDAAAQSEETAAPILRDGEAVIPEGSDAGTVKKILAKSLISNYDQLDPDSRDNLDWEFECVGWQKVDVAHKLDSNTVFGDINGFESSVKKGSGFFSTTLHFQHNALASQADGSYKVRLKSNPDTVVLLSKVAKLSSNIVANNNVSVKLVYNDDGTINYDNINEAVFNAAVKSSTPNLTFNDVNITYKAKSGLDTDWMPLKGGKGTILTYPGVTEGTHRVKIAFPGNDKYYSKEVELDVTFTGREAVPEIEDKDITVDASFNEDLSIDYDALREAIWEQVSVSLPKNVKFEDVSFTYYFTYGNVYKDWVSFEGKDGVNIDALNIHINIPGVAIGNYQVKLTWGGDKEYKSWEQEITVNVVDGRTDTSISFVEDCTVNIPFTETGIDYEAVKESIWALVDTITPADISKDSITVKYEGTDINDNPAISESNHTLNFSYAGSANYKPFSTDVTVNFVDGRNVAFESKDKPDTIGVGFNAKQEYDVAQTLTNIREALVNQLGDVPLDKVTVKCRSSINVYGNYEDLSLTGLKALMTTNTALDIKLSYAGDANHKPYNPDVFKGIKLEDKRPQATIVLKTDASITYNMESDVMKQAIFDNVIDWDSENTKLPAKETLTLDDFVITYYAEAQIKSGTDIGDELLKKLSPYMHKWVGIEGEENTILEVGVIYPQMGAGEQQIRIQYVGNKEYRPSTEAEGNLTVKKADVKVKVHSTSIYPNEVPGDDFVTLNPNDPAIDVYVIYGGVTSNLSGSIYLQLPSANPNLVNAINKALEYMGKPPLQEGITVGELKAILNEIINFGGENSLMQEAIKLILKQYGIDYGTLKNIINALNKLPSLSDNVRIVIGFPPNHAGLYLAIAVTDNENYNTAIGTGLLTVKMRVAGVKIQLNDNLTKKLTVDQAKALAADPNGIASLLYNGEAVKNPNLHFLYSGVQSNFRPYSSTTDFPTEPGRYVVTVVTLGGDYLSAPVTKTFQITK